MHDDGQPSPSTRYTSHLNDGRPWESLEVRSEFNGVWTQRLGALSIKGTLDGELTCSLVEDDA